MLNIFTYGLTSTNASLICRLEYFCWEPSISENFSPKCSVTENQVSQLLLLFVFILFCLFGGGDVVMTAVVSIVFVVHFVNLHVLSIIFHSFIHSIWSALERIQ